MTVSVSRKATGIKVGVVPGKGAAWGSLSEGETGVTVTQHTANRTAQCGTVHIIHVNYTTTAV